VVTTSALSRRFEVVLKHAPVRGGQPYRGTLYLADFPTNLPVRGATIVIEEPGVTGRPFTVRATAEPGVYAVERPAGFARDGRFNVAVRVSAGGANDLVLLQNLYVGPVEEPAAAVEATATTGGGDGGEGLPWAWLLGVAALAAAFAGWLVWSARKRRQAPAPPDAPETDAPAVPSASERVPARSRETVQ